VGPSGSGKSTIAKLIASFWDTDSGSITYGGVDEELMDEKGIYRNFVSERKEAVSWKIA